MKIYLAGPDVFRPDALAHFADARALLTAHGHQALIPLDNEETTASGIYAANLGLIRQANAVLANLNPFRGSEPDSGTAFEVGFALALGLPVIGYLDDARPQIVKLAERQGGELARHNGRPVDADGLGVEDFGLPLNLMLAVPCPIVEGRLAAALQALDARFPAAT